MLENWGVYVTTVDRPAVGGELLCSTHWTQYGAEVNAHENQKMADLEGYDQMYYIKALKGPFAQWSFHYPSWHSSTSKLPGWIRRLILFLR